MSGETWVLGKPRFGKLLVVCAPDVGVGMQLPTRDQHRSTLLQDFVADADGFEHLSTHHSAGGEAKAFMEGSIKDSGIGTKGLDIQVA